MKRTGTKINIVQRTMERKLNLFSHTCRMQDDRLIKQAVFGIMDGKNKKGRPRRRWTDDLVDWCKGYLHPVWNGVGQKEMESFRKVCRGHQRTLSPWSKRRRKKIPSLDPKRPTSSPRGTWVNFGKTKGGWEKIATLA